MSKTSNKRAVTAPRRDVFLVDPNEVVVIGLDTDDGPEHPLWDAHARDEVDQASVDNIKTYGVIEPVIVTKDGERMLVVDGRTRAKWARAAAKQQCAAGEVEVRLPVMFRRADERTLFGVSRSANAHRRVESILTNAQTAQRALALGSTHDEVANILGVTPKTIREWLAVIDLAAPVRRAVESGEVSPSAAARLGKMSKDEQIEALASLRAEGGKATTRRAANKARAAKGKSAIKSAKERVTEAAERIRHAMPPLHNDLFGADFIYVRRLLTEIYRVLTDEMVIPEQDEVEHAIADDQIVAEQEA